MYFRALFDYLPNKIDELQLKKNELYIVVEKCQDGWYKGFAMENLKLGVFPGNYVMHINKTTEDCANGTIHEIPSAGKLPPPPQIGQSKIKLLCIQDYPSSTDFELTLKKGDIILLIKKRDDGWFKGKKLDSGKIGLFPASFVKEI